MTPVEIRLRDARKAAGLTPAELAAKTGIDQGNLSRIENGNTGGMSLVEPDYATRQYTP